MALENCNGCIHEDVYRKYYDCMFCRDNNHFKLPDPIVLEPKTPVDIFINVSLGRFSQGDWGTLSDEDRQQNEDGLKNGERLMGVYIQRGNKHSRNRNCRP